MDEMGLQHAGQPKPKRPSRAARRVHLQPEDSPLDDFEVALFTRLAQSYGLEVSERTLALFRLCTRLGLPVGAMLAHLESQDHGNDDNSVHEDKNGENNDDGDGESDPEVSDLKRYLRQIMRENNDEVDSDDDDDDDVYYMDMEPDSNGLYPGDYEGYRWSSDSDEEIVVPVYTAITQPQRGGRGGRGGRARSGGRS
jgi:hypothetical protein